MDLFILTRVLETFSRENSSPRTMSTFKSASGGEKMFILNVVIWPEKAFSGLFFFFIYFYYYYYFLIKAFLTFRYKIEIKKEKETRTHVYLVCKFQ